MIDATFSTLQIVHRTRYRYEETVSFSRHRSFLTPRATPRQVVGASTLRIDPPPSESTSFLDYYGNRVTLFAVDSAHDRLLIEARSEVTIDGGVMDRAGSISTQDARDSLKSPQNHDVLRALEFCFRSPHVPIGKPFADYAIECFGQGNFRADVTGLMRRIHQEFEYDPSLTIISTPAAEVFSRKGGVCQDFAHVMLACLRSAGLAARYVSGYLVPGSNVVGAQASHAWISVYEPGIGWIDFDPTNDVLPSGGHVTLAWGRDYSDVSPFSGVTTGGGEHEVLVEVEVRP